MSILQSCILKQEVPLLFPELCDHRYFVFRNQSGVRVGSYVCDIARDAAMRKLREYHAVNASEDIWLRYLEHFVGNQSMLGFLIEESCLSSISLRGLRIGMGLSPGMGIAAKWFSQKVPVYSLEQGVTIYIPVKYNFRAIDALILNLDTVEKRKKATIFAVQITIAKSHSDSESKFFENWPQWCSGLDDYEVEFHFLLITDDMYHSSKWWKEKTRPSRGAEAETIVSPGYTSHRIPLSHVNKDVADRLRSARERKNISFLPTNPLDGYTLVPTLGDGDSSSTGIPGPKRKSKHSKKAGSTADREGKVGEISAASVSIVTGKRKAAAKSTTKGKPTAIGMLTVRRSARLAAFANR